MNEQEYDPRVWYLWLNIQKKEKRKREGIIIAGTQR